MTSAELRARAREQLGGGIFTSKWLMAVAACFIVSLICTAIGGLIPYVGMIVVTGPMTYSLTYVFLKQARDHGEMDLGDLFKSSGPSFSQQLMLGLMIIVFISLWSMLFVIPAIVKAYSYSMAYYIQADHPDWGWKDCITDSRRMMDGHKTELFILDLSFIGWIFVSACLCGIGSLWVTPYIQAAHTQFYESIR